MEVFDSVLGIKKQHQREGNTENAFMLSLVHNPDILGELASYSETLARCVRVGFAAETQDLLVNAQSKLQRKKLDMLIANDVTRSDSGFGTDTNKVHIFHANGSIEDLPVMSKSDVAAAIWDRVVPLLSTQ